MKEYSISLVYAICTSLPFSFTGADAKVTVVGFTDTASKPVSLKMAAGAVPFDPRFMLFGKLPGLMSIATSIGSGWSTNLCGRGATVTGLQNTLPHHRFGGSPRSLTPERFYWGESRLCKRA